MLCFGVWPASSVSLGKWFRSQSKPPRLVLPDELFVNIAKSIGAEVNQALGFLQDLACGGNIKQFLALRLPPPLCYGHYTQQPHRCHRYALVEGFVAFHTLPVLYERYEDQVDGFVYSVLDQLQHQYRKLDADVLSKIPKGKLDKRKKHE
ncbi:hypothetical protein ACSBR1_037200 [Camellia fascicularis]